MNGENGNNLTPGGQSGIIPSETPKEPEYHSPLAMMTLWLDNWIKNNNWEHHDEYLVLHLHLERKILTDINIGGVDEETFKRKRWNEHFRRRHKK